LEGDREDEPVMYVVVVNDAQQYSIWASDRPLPDGWRREGHIGTRHDCLAHIDEIWTDMRPRAVRQPSTT
jgi:MbtH protein